MKQINVLFLVIIFSFTSVYANEELDFSKWKRNFKILALKNTISEKTFE